MTTRKKAIEALDSVADDSPTEEVKEDRKDKKRKEKKKREPGDPVTFKVGNLNSRSKDEGKVKLTYDPVDSVKEVTEDVRSNVKVRESGRQGLRSNSVGGPLHPTKITEVLSAYLLPGKVAGEVYFEGTILCGPKLIPYTTVYPIFKGLKKFRDLDVFYKSSVNEKGYKVPGHAFISSHGLASRTVTSVLTGRSDHIDQTLMSLSIPMPYLLRMSKSDNVSSVRKLIAKQLLETWGKFTVFEMTILAKNIKNLEMAALKIVEGFEVQSVDPIDDWFHGKQLNLVQPPNSKRKDIQDAIQILVGLFDTGIDHKVVNLKSRMEELLAVVFAVTCMSQSNVFYKKLCEILEDDEVDLKLDYVKDLVDIVGADKFKKQLKIAQDNHWKECFNPE